MSAPAPRRGRRPAGEDARGAIVAAARAEFGSKGYDSTTMRGVARAAGVDPRLVHHYFTGKDDLFVAAVDLPVRPQDVVAAVLAGPQETLGERLVLTLVSIWDSPAGRERVVALLSGALATEAGARMLREFVTREVLGRVAAGLDADRPQTRAALVASHILGLAMARTVVGLPALADADPAWLAATVGPAIQRYFTEPLPA